MSSTAPLAVMGSARTVSNDDQQLFNRHGGDGGGGGGVKAEETRLTKLRCHYVVYRVVIMYDSG